VRGANAFLLNNEDFDFKNSCAVIELIRDPDVE
jgi:hypothetical protein